jgi:serine protease Do
MVKKIALSLVANGKIERGYLGVTISDLTNELKEIYTNKEGALIMGVEENAAADKAKLKRGDLIVKIDNKPIKNANELKNTIGEKNPNDKINLTYERSGKIYTVSLKLDKMDGDEVVKEASNESSIIGGLSLENITDPTKYNLPKNTKGVIVTKVADGGVGEKAGFRAGDVIIQVNESAISSIDELKNALKSKGKKPVYVSRGGYVAVLVLQ